MKWEILNISKKSITSITGIVDVLLKNRKIKDQNEFFNPISPEKIKLEALGISKLGINKAIKRIKIARKNKEKVIIYGDYDADGICGTAILWETLYSLGLDVLPYIPERFTEGYGLNAQSIEKLKTLNPKLKLIITIDHGIVANRAVKAASKLDIDVIITDHHEPGKVKPEAYAIVHTTKIGGSAVAWVLSREIKKQVSGLDLVAIGTIADQLPLMGANRSFAKYGLEELNKTKRLGLLALFQEAGISGIGTYEVGYIIAPRLNAMGRLENAMDSLRLLCIKSSQKAKDLAFNLGKINRERQRLVEEIIVHIKERVKEDKIIVLAHEEYHEGVIGLAAAKLVEEFYRPAIILSKKADVSKASARSISGFNIIEAIRKLEDLYLEGGGHPMAAGFSIETVKIEEFTRKINQIAKPLLTAEILAKRLKIDLELHFNQLNWELYNQLKEFEPTGPGNPTQTFVSRGVEVLESRTVGRDSSHLKLRLKQDAVVFDAIAFGFGNLLPEITPGTKIDVAYTIESNSWNSRQALQLKVKDLRI